MVKLNCTALQDDMLDALMETLTAHPGSCPVYVELTTTDGKRVTIRTDNDFFVSASDKLLRDVEGLVGPGRVFFGRR
jgi:hypothetical protein